MTQPQPSPGDVVLGCIHEPDMNSAHVFQVPKGMVFVRPDGTRGTATWVLLCDECFLRRDGKLKHAPIGCDMVWEEGMSIHYRKPS